MKMIKLDKTFSDQMKLIKLDDDFPQKKLKVVFEQKLIEKGFTLLVENGWSSIQCAYVF